MQDAVAQLGTSKEGIMALELIQEKFKGMNPQQKLHSLVNLHKVILKQQCVILDTGIINKET